MRIFLAGFATETNTFSPFPTSERGFAEFGLERGASKRSEHLLHSATEAWRACAARDGHEIVESFNLFAQPSGRTARSFYEHYRDAITADIAAAMPVDIVLLTLHGAMAAVGYDDCEGDLLGRIRTIVGRRAVIGALFDPHCHLTQAIVDHTDVPILMKEYPHVDSVERAQEIYRICVGAAHGQLRPTRAMFDCKMIGFYPTTEHPMRDYVDAMCDAERGPGVLSVSLAHGFPWADVADVGTRTLVITDADEALAKRLAEAFARRLFDLRRSLLPRFPGIDQALDQALANAGTVVLADTADNAGGGAPSDNMAFLRRILERGITSVVSGCYWDPMAAMVCHDAGVGAVLDLRIGGKAGATSGHPLDVRATVLGLSEAYEQTGLPGMRQLMGPSAWIHVQGVDVVLNSLRTQVFHPDAFTGLGIPISERRFIVVKSAQHFYAGFAPIADRIIHVATPGVLQMDFSKVAYTLRDANYWPRVSDPFSGALGG